MKEEIIILGSDHAGFSAKEKIKEFLSAKDIAFEDLGSYKYSKNDDYPIYAIKVAEKVAKNKKFRGILICGSGIGMEIAANKVKGVRATEAYDTHSARMSRIDNDSNILSLSAKDLSQSKMNSIINIWLSTKFSNAKRHKRRIKEISDYEKRK